MTAFRQQLTDSIAIECAVQSTGAQQLQDALNTPGARAGFAVYQLCETVKDLEMLARDPIAKRHVQASREDLRRMAIRLAHLVR